MAFRVDASAVAAALLAVLIARPVAGQVFSPGELSKPHQDLEGLKNCTKCHVAGAKLAPDRCLSCHEELKPQLARGEGFHGRLDEAARGSCQSCHHEHQGKDFALIDWGEGGARRFDHSRAGYTLKGQHAKVECAACHQEKRIVTSGVRRLLAEHPGRKTFLGLATRCWACHADEHRGQLGQECAQCHDEKGFAPVRNFSHDRTDFRLEGKHRPLACAACHARESDEAATRRFPAAVHADFARYKPVKHESCASCHADPHKGVLGADCASCHTVDDFRQIRSSSGPGAPGGSKARAFHDKTAFPLRGAHATAVCAACHGPWKGQPTRFKGTPFQTCATCHFDAHAGQLGTPGTPLADCSRCHGLSAFTPPQFELADHQRTKFPLQGAHGTVACSACHRADPALLTGRVARAAARELERRRRPVLLSAAVLHPSAGRCETCHADVHRGQFANRAARGGCAACHTVASFREVEFDHSETRFPLEGKHAALTCAACHFAERGLVRYKPLPTACGGCHQDVHVGQFDDENEPKDCEACHTIAGFRPASRFQHAPPFTKFLLEGRHAPLQCASCHPAVKVAEGVEVRRYKPLPTDCAGCHADYHHGAMRRFAQ
jgi:hypothetical protein